LLVILVGALAFLLGRRQWFSPWVWRGWALALLAIPVSSAVLDTAPAHILQPIAFLLLVICGFHFLVNGGGRGLTKAAALLLIPLVIAWFLIPGPVPDPGDWIGPCHLFSELRENGCVRSVPLSQGVPILIHPAPQTGREQLIRAYGSAVWIESPNRWKALINSRPIRTDMTISFLALNLDRNQLQTYYADRFLFQILRIATTYIDLQSGEVTGPIRMNESFTETVMEYVEETRGYRWRTVQPADPAVWAEGQLVSLAKTIDSNLLYLVDPATGENLTTVSLDDYYIQYPDFSSDGKYLAVTTYKRESDAYWGLIFDVEKLLPPEVETPG
jgi:hypothetical protein